MSFNRPEDWFSALGATLPTPQNARKYYGQAVSPDIRETAQGFIPEWMPDWYRRSITTQAQRMGPGEQAALRGLSAMGGTLQAGSQEVLQPFWGGGMMVRDQVARGIRSLTDKIVSPFPDSQARDLLQSALEAPTAPITGFANPEAALPEQTRAGLAKYGEEQAQRLPLGSLGWGVATDPTTYIPFGGQAAKIATLGGELAAHPNLLVRAGGQALRAGAQAGELYNVAVDAPVEALVRQAAKGIRHAPIIGAAFDPSKGALVARMQGGVGRALNEALNFGQSTLNKAGLYEPLRRTMDQFTNPQELKLPEGVAMWGSLRKMVQSIGDRIQAYENPHQQFVGVRIMDDIVDRKNWFEAEAAARRKELREQVNEQMITPAEFDEATDATFQWQGRNVAALYQGMHETLDKLDAMEFPEVHRGVAAELNERVREGIQRMHDEALSKRDMDIVLKRGPEGDSVLFRRAHPEEMETLEAARDTLYRDARETQRTYLGPLADEIEAQLGAPDELTTGLIDDAMQFYSGRVGELGEFAKPALERLGVVSKGARKTMEDHLPGILNATRRWRLVRERVIGNAAPLLEKYYRARPTEMVTDLAELTRGDAGQVNVPTAREAAAAVLTSSARLEKVLQRIESSQALPGEWETITRLKRDLQKYKPAASDVLKPEDGFKMTMYEWGQKYAASQGVKSPPPWLSWYHTMMGVWRDTALLSPRFHGVNLIWALFSGQMDEVQSGLVMRTLGENFKDANRQLGGQGPAGLLGWLRAAWEERLYVPSYAVELVPGLKELGRGDGNGFWIRPHELAMQTDSLTTTGAGVADEALRRTGGGAVSRIPHAAWGAGVGGVSGAVAYQQTEGTQEEKLAAAARAAAIGAAGGVALRPFVWASKTLMRVIEDAVRTEATVQWMMRSIPEQRELLLKLIDGQAEETLETIGKPLTAGSDLFGAKPVRTMRDLMRVFPEPAGYVPEAADAATQAAARVGFPPFDLPPQAPPAMPPDLPPAPPTAPAAAPSVEAAPPEPAAPTAPVAPAEAPPIAEAAPATPGAGRQFFTTPADAHERMAALRTQADTDVAGHPDLAKHDAAIAKAQAKYDAAAKRQRDYTGEHNLQTNPEWKKLEQARKAARQPIARAEQARQSAEHHLAHDRLVELLRQLDPEELRQMDAHYVTVPTEAMPEAAAVAPEPAPITVRPAPTGDLAAAIDAMPLADYVKDTMRLEVGQAERLGIVDRIEEMAAQGMNATLAAQRLKGELGARTSLSDVDLRSVVRSVRAAKGIPSLDEVAEYEAWRKAYVARQATPTAPVATAAPRPAGEPLPADFEPSEGHVGVFGDWEYFYGDHGDLLRAPVDGYIQANGYRSGARFESTAVMADRMIDQARKTFGERTATAAPEVAPAGATPPGMNVGEAGRTPAAPPVEPDEVLYHGTPAAFDRFDPTIAPRSGVSHGGGVFFSRDRDVAQQWAEGGRVVDVRVGGDTLDLTTPAAWPEELVAQLRASRDDYDRWLVEEYDQALASGADRIEGLFNIAPSSPALHAYVRAQGIGKLALSDTSFAGGTSIYVPDVGRIRYPEPSPLTQAAGPEAPAGPPPEVGLPGVAPPGRYEAARVYAEDHPEVKAAYEQAAQAHTVFRQSERTRPGATKTNARLWSAYAEADKAYEATKKRIIDAEVARSGQSPEVGPLPGTPEREARDAARQAELDRELEEAASRVGANPPPLEPLPRPSTTAGGGAPPQGPYTPQPGDFSYEPRPEGFPQGPELRPILRVGMSQESPTLSYGVTAAQKQAVKDWITKQQHFAPGDLAAFAESQGVRPIVARQWGEAWANGIRAAEDIGLSANNRINYDYADVSKLTDALRSTGMFPFITWSVKTTPRVAQWLLSDPRLFLAIDRLNNLSEDDIQEAGLSPSYARLARLGGLGDAIAEHILGRPDATVLAQPWAMFMPFTEVGRPSRTTEDAGLVEKALDVGATFGASVGPLPQLAARLTGQTTELGGSVFRTSPYLEALNVAAGGKPVDIEAGLKQGIRGVRDVFGADDAPTITGSPIKDYYIRARIAEIEFERTGKQVAGKNLAAMDDPNSELWKRAEREVNRQMAGQTVSAAVIPFRTKALSETAEQVGLARLRQGITPRELATMTKEQKKAAWQRAEKAEPAVSVFSNTGSDEKGVVGRQLQQWSLYKRQTQRMSPTKRAQLRRDFLDQRPQLQKYLATHPLF